jgi:hypothetical protein
LGHYGYAKLLIGLLLALFLKDGPEAGAGFSLFMRPLPLYPPKLADPTF